jgi:hypothetical protein
MIDAISDIKRLSGLVESEQVNEAAMRTIDDAINALANLRQRAKEMQINHVNTGGLSNDVVEELYNVILFLEKHRDIMHRG